MLRFKLVCNLRSHVNYGSSNTCSWQNLARNLLSMTCIIYEQSFEIPVSVASVVGWVVLWNSCLSGVSCGVGCNRRAFTTGTFLLACLLWWRCDDCIRWLYIMTHIDDVEFCLCKIDVHPFAKYSGLLILPIGNRCCYQYPSSLLFWFSSVLWWDVPSWLLRRYCTQSITWMTGMMN